jgi:hypothetical protein
MLSRTVTPTHRTFAIAALSPDTDYNSELRNRGLLFGRSACQCKSTVFNRAAFR